MSAWRARGLLGASHHLALRPRCPSINLMAFVPPAIPQKAGRGREERSRAEWSREPNLGVGGRQGLPGDGVGRGIITFVGFVSGSSGAPSRLFAYLQRRSLEDWAPYASVASYVLPRCL